jgi:hypothetical protein
MNHYETVIAKWCLIMEIVVSQTAELYPREEISHSKSRML